MKIEVDKIKLKSLRERFLVSISDCSNALIEANNDEDKAIDILKKKGIQKSSGISSRATDNGYIAVSYSNGVLYVISVKCETDFVANSEQFVKFINIVNRAADQNNDNLDSILANNKDLVDDLAMVRLSLKEQINITLKSYKVGSNLIAWYGHNAHPIASQNSGQKIGIVLYETLNNTNLDTAKVFSRQVAMHVVAMEPKALSREFLDVKILQEEKSRILEQLSTLDKPQNVKDKIAEGKMSKFVSEICLLEQSFVVNPDITVEQASKDHNVNIKGYFIFSVKGS